MAGLRSLAYKVRTYLSAGRDVHGIRNTGALPTGKAAISGFTCCPQGHKERFELLAALSAHVEVFLDQRHGLGGVQAGELHRYEAIHLLEALVAADLSPLMGLGYLLYHRFENTLVDRRSF